MGKRAITPELFNDLVRAYRLQPGIFGAAARASGCAHKTAKKAWLTGWPEKKFPPIEELLKGERKQCAATVALTEGEEAIAEREKMMGEMKERLDSDIEAEASRAYAMQVKLEEVRLLGTVRGMVTSHAQSLCTMAEASELLSSRLAESIREFAMDDTKELVFGEKDYNQAHRAFRGVAMAARDISTAVKTVLEAERLHMGEATQIVGHKDLDEMSIEDLMAEIAEADDSIADAKRRGLVAIDGGFPPPRNLSNARSFSPWRPPHHLFRLPTRSILARVGERGGTPYRSAHVCSVGPI